MGADGGAEVEGQAAEGKGVGHVLGLGEGDDAVGAVMEKEDGSMYGVGVECGAESGEGGHVGQGVGGPELAAEGAAGAGGEASGIRGRSWERTTILRD